MKTDEDVTKKQVDEIFAEEKKRERKEEKEFRRRKRRKPHVSKSKALSCRMLSYMYAMVPSWTEREALDATWRTGSKIV